MSDRITRFLEQHPLLVPVLLLGVVFACERVAFQIGRNLLPLMSEEFGDAAQYWPFAMSAGGIAGYGVWFAAGALGARRRWAVGMIAGLALAGALATTAPALIPLLLGAFFGGVAGFGGSFVLNDLCERMAAEDDRRAFSHRANSNAELAVPALLAGATLLARDGDWRLALAAGALALPALACVVALAMPRAPRPASRKRVRAREALADARRQLRDRPVALSAGSSALTTVALAPFAPLMALAAVDSVGVTGIAVITVLATPTVLIGQVWERVFGKRPRAALAAAFLPAFAGWALVLTLLLIGDGWPRWLQVALWAVATLAWRLGFFSTDLVANGIALSAGAGELPRGFLSVRAAIQQAPAAVAGTVGMLALPALLELERGFVVVAVTALVLLGGASVLMHAAHRN